MSRLSRFTPLGCFVALVVACGGSDTSKDSLLDPSIALTTAYVPQPGQGGCFVCCGGNGEVPCPNGAGGQCNGWLQVTGNLCAPCGGADGVSPEVQCNGVGAGESGCAPGTVLGRAGTTCVPDSNNAGCPQVKPDTTPVVILECIACGNGGEPVCAGNVCNPGSEVVQVNETGLPQGPFKAECLACGAAGEPPCEAGGCNAGLTDVQNLCLSCPSGAGPFLDNNGACVVCGTAGNPPCPLGDSNVWDGGIIGTNGCDAVPVNQTVYEGVCTPCGAAGEIPCGGTGCNGGESLGLLNGVCAVCSPGTNMNVDANGNCFPCGAIGQPACEDGSCPAAQCMSPPCNDTCGQPPDDIPVTDTTTPGGAKGVYLVNGTCTACGNTNLPQCPATPSCSAPCTTEPTYATNLPNSEGSLVAPAAGPYAGRCVFGVWQTWTCTPPEVSGIASTPGPWMLMIANTGDWGFHGNLNNSSPFPQDYTAGITIDAWNSQGQQYGQIATGSINSGSGGAVGLNVNNSSWDLQGYDPTLQVDWLKIQAAGGNNQCRLGISADGAETLEDLGLVITAGPGAVTTAAGIAGAVVLGSVAVGQNAPKGKCGVEVTGAPNGSPGVNGVCTWSY